jgi:GST-like protein
LLEILDTQLDGKEYIRGDMSVVDFAIAPYLITKLTREIDMTNMPNLKAWLIRMENLKGFVDTIVKMPPG